MVLSHLIYTTYIMRSYSNCAKIVWPYVNSYQLSRKSEHFYGKIAAERYDEEHDKGE